jgi:hypothetical protein
MKSKHLLILLIPIAIAIVSGIFTSCKKDKSGAGLPIDSIASRIISPSRQICACGGNKKYLLDLDMDGVPDIELNMVCFTNQWYEPLYSCSPWTLNTLYAVNVDSVLNSRIMLSASSYSLAGYSTNDSISPSSYPLFSPMAHVCVSPGVLEANPAMYYGSAINNPGQRNMDTSYGSYNIPATGSEYFGFRKTLAGGGYKYGWFALHFDSTYNYLYLDGVAINNTVNKPILAGAH